MSTGSRRGTLFYNTDISKNIKVTNNKYQKIKALQAHSKFSQFKSFFKRIYKCIKRVSPRLSVKASVSIEASIVIPIFLFCFLEVLSLLNYLYVYSGVLYAIKSVAEPISIYGYAYEELIDTEDEVSLGKEVISALIFSEVYMDTQIKKKCEERIYQDTIVGGVHGIQFLGTHIDQRKSCIDVIAHYTVKPLFFLAGTEQSMSNRYYAKLWTGYSLEDSAVSEEYVYITENGSVYHLTDSCTHLKLSISDVNREELVDLRNESRGKYYECEKCCENGGMQEIYYITKQGDRYHAMISCSGLKRTMYRVKKQEVGDLPVCSRCSQMKGA